MSCGAARPRTDEPSPARCPPTVTAVGRADGWPSDGWPSDGWPGDGWPSDGWRGDGWRGDGRRGCVGCGRAPGAAADVVAADVAAADAVTVSTAIPFRWGAKSCRPARMPSSADWTTCDPTESAGTLITWSAAGGPIAAMVPDVNIELVAAG